MPDNITNDDLLSIIDNATDRIMDDSDKVELPNDNHFQSIKQKRDEAQKIIEATTEDKLRKEQSEMLSDDIKKRFARLRKISKDNFNMFEVAILCNQISKDYKKLAQLNHWVEIERMLD
ncbi:MAG: hypothetical protein H7A24_11765 [Leptospiraceae bacterium]|nr:hypothetical protein [Leptospiraceae bacterium]MCP5512550.1 hypothetical protein [Leptospiraceae bacterium]